MADNDIRTETEDPTASEKDGAMLKPLNLAEEVGLPARDSISPPKSIATDIAAVLKDAKLPERRDFRSSGDVPTAPATVQSEVPVHENAVDSHIEETPPRDVVAAVHTLKDDFQSAVHDQKMSLVRAAALEEVKRSHAHHEEDIHAVTASRRARSLRSWAIVVTLALLGVIAIGAVALMIQVRKGIAPAEFVVEGLLFSEKTLPLVYRGENVVEFKRRLTELRLSHNLSLGAITRVALMNSAAETDISRELTTREFFEGIGARMPEKLLRALGEEFFFGYHSVDENAPIIIIPVVSYERAFPAMLEWESSLNADLSPMFTHVPPLMRQDGLLVERTFGNSVMRNFDARVLADDSGTVQLFYAFPTRNILIIAESPYSFSEILARLRADMQL